jgi:BMFP domain-containing protein YqiC
MEKKISDLEQSIAQLRSENQTLLNRINELEQKYQQSSKDNIK